jgi:hypothetical protein
MWRQWCRVGNRNRERGEVKHGVLRPAWVPRRVGGWSWGLFLYPVWLGRLSGWVRVCSTGQLLHLGVPAGGGRGRFRRTEGRPRGDYPLVVTFWPLPSCGMFVHCVELL